MIKFIRPQDVLNIRSEILRDGKLPPAECMFPGDDDPEAFHLGYFDNDQLVCICSFHPQSYNEEQNPERISLPGEKAFQLRGMATLPGFRHRGLGNQIVNFAIIYLRGRKVNYLWCNARKVAYSFYLGLGFEFISKEFEIKNIGPHKSMYLKIQ